MLDRLRFTWAEIRDARGARVAFACTIAVSLFMSGVAAWLAWECLPNYVAFAWPLLWAWAEWRAWFWFAKHMEFRRSSRM